MPMLTEVNTSLPPRMNGDARAFIMRSARAWRRSIFNVVEHNGEFISPKARDVKVSPRRRDRIR